VAVWGDNSFGQTNQPAGLSNVVAVAAGGNHTLALRTNGTVVAWGENTDAEGNIAGQSAAPWGLTNVVAVAAGEYHSLALKADGTVAAWGDNSQGQIGVPPDLTNVAAVVGGGAHSVALHGDGTLTAWGADWNNQCAVPSELFPAVGVAAGTYHTVVLLEGAMPVPRLMAPAKKGSQFSATVQTLAPRSYALEYKDSLVATNWTNVCTTPGNGALRILTDPTATGTQRFYRMRQW
jgi:alpha-tubulin suppressor-like RCC1 family protein